MTNEMAETLLDELMTIERLRAETSSGLCPQVSQSSARI